MMSGPFTVYWHRAGNSAAGIADVVRAQRASPTPLADRPVRHGVECDLKWTEELLYLHHGPTGLERLTTKQVRRKEERGEVLLLEDALSLPGASALHWMVELKRGFGPQARAVRRCVELFEQHDALDRMLVVSSSLAVLADVRADHPDIATGLFIGWTFASGRVLHVPKLGIPRALKRGLAIDPHALPEVDVLIPTNPFTATRATGKPQLPIATSHGKLEQLARLGMAGAFAYFKGRTGTARPARPGAGARPSPPARPPAAAPR